MPCEKRKAEAAPEKICVHITLEKLYPMYAETVHHVLEDADSLRKILGTLGYAKDDLRTTHISVERQTHRIGERRQNFGFSYRHQMKLEIDAGQERLEDLLHVLAGCPLEPVFEVVHLP